MKKAAPYILLLILVAAIIVIKRYKDAKQSESKTNTVDITPDVNRNRGFDRRINFLEYTAHARCRMECRKISEAEVEEIMQRGEINYRKTNVGDRPCPSYSLEGLTRDRQRVRIVFAQCDFKTKVVTVIDLETEWGCDCPGNDRKFQNKN